MPSSAERTIAGRYRLLDALGRGGMGIVWRARDEYLHRDVAVKEILLPGGLDDTTRAGLLERFVREARAAAHLDHPAIISVYDVVTEDDLPWMVMRLVRGRSLDQLVREDGPLPPGPCESPLTGDPARDASSRGRPWPPVAFGTRRRPFAETHRGQNDEESRREPTTAAPAGSAERVKGCQFGGRPARRDGLGQ